MAALTFLPSLTPQSTLAELPAWDLRLPVTALGSEIDDVLRRVPELPGVVVDDDRGVRGAVSRAQFQQMISRPFGREVVRPREIRLLIDEIAPGDPMILDVTLPVQEAVRRALARGTSMIYEPVLAASNGSSDVKLIGFTDLLQADSRISSLRNQQMQEILATVQEGFLLVDRDHRIASEYSKSVEVILGTPKLAGLRLPVLLGDLLGRETGDLTQSYLNTLFNPNVIERLVADINPLKSVQLPEREGRPRQHLRFAFRRSFEGREIQRILVRVEDHTREVLMATEIEEQERQAGQRVDLAMEIMQVEPRALTDYLTRYLAEVPRIEQMRAREDGLSMKATIDSIFRILHSLKGEAGLIGLRSFAQRLHRTEDVVVALRGQPALVPGGLAELDPWLRLLAELGAEAKELIERLSALVSWKSSEPRTRPQDLVEAMEGLIAELAARLRKPARLVAHWNAADLPTEYGSVVREALIQLARNSMVHGVESLQERREANKPAAAALQIALRRYEAEGQLEIVFQDDGRGLDLARIRDRARATLGMAHLDDDQARQIIFEPGFSTANTTTGDAGRGVGLDLVRDTVEGLGGTIAAHSEPGVFCAFQIVLPLQPEIRS